MKYRCAFVNEWLATFMIEYETEAELPRVGDLFQPPSITPDKDMNTYRIKRLYHIPEDSALTNVIIELEVEKRANGMDQAGEGTSPAA